MAVTYNRETGVLVVDNTILSTFGTCKLKAAISYGLDRRLSADNNGNLEAGKALHKALEYYYQLYSPEECLAVLKEEYEDWALANLFDNKRLSYNNIELVFRSWMDKNPQDKLPFRVTPDNVEVAFGVPLNDDGSIIFTGRMDLLATARQGSALFAVDHKTTGTVDSRKKKQYSMDSQMSGYLWALQQLGKDISGIYINVVHTGIVPTSNRKCATHKTLYDECGFLHMAHQLLGPYQRSPDDLARWHSMALYQASAWKKTLDYLDGDINKVNRVMATGTWIYQACINCPWSDYCGSGQKLHWLKDNTIISEWKPGILSET